MRPMNCVCPCSSVFLKAAEDCAHSKTWRIAIGPNTSRSVLECVQSSAAFAFPFIGRLHIPYCEAVSIFERASHLHFVLYKSIESPCVVSYKRDIHVSRFTCKSHTLIVCLSRSRFFVPIFTSGSRYSSSICPIIASAAFTGPGFDSINKSLNNG